MGDALSVWMNGQLAGTWSVGRTGLHRLEYAPDWPLSPHARPLSLSLPFTPDLRLEGDVVRNYFDNLLPDSENLRRRIGARFRTKSVDVFALLQAVGRDCVGAVQLLPPGMPPQGFDQVYCETLTTGQIEDLLSALGTTAAGAQDGLEEFRLSIAGAQEKTALLRVGGRWAQPQGATPTTHILKPPIGITPGRNLDLRLSVENEWLCSQIARELGMPVAQCQIERFGQRRALVVERFDRAWHADGWVVRLPQEDFCQARGIPSAQKYEQSGGPGIQSCLGVLKGAQDYEQDACHFLCAQLLFWLLAAIDGHAKNFSLFMLPGGHYRLTPLYDILSAWPLIGSGAHDLPYKKVKMAMAVRGSAAHYRMSEIQPRHWRALAQRSAADGAWQAMLDMARRLEDALTAVRQRLPADFPAALAEAIFQGTRRHLRLFLREADSA